jgi:hypothetical protein
LVHHLESTESDLDRVEGRESVAGTGRKRRHKIKAAARHHEGDRRFPHGQINIIRYLK